MKNSTSLITTCLKSCFYLFTLVLVSSCVSLSSEKIAPSYNYAFKAIKNALFGYPDLNISREIVENIPYASGLLKIGKGTQGLVILASVENSDYLWVSKDEVYIVTKDGRIERSLGLLNNLTKITSINQSFKDLITKPNPVTEYYSYYSFEGPVLLDLKVSISIANR